MTETTNSHINIFELPFLLYVAIVDSKAGLSTDKAEKFIQAISQSENHESPILQDILHKAINEYSHSWKRYQSGEFSSPLQNIQHIHETILSELDEASRAVYKKDLLALIESLFNSASDIYLAAPQSKQKIHELIISIILETAVKQKANLKSSSTQNDKKLQQNNDLAKKNIQQQLARLWPLAQLNSKNAVFWESGKINLRCIQIIDETHDVKTFRFVSNDNNQLFFYKPGQFISIELTIKGEKVIRSYTLSSSPSRPHNLSITVKRVAGGMVSNWLHDNMSVGAILSANGPMGKFNCFDLPAQKMLLISAGSGITPVMSMMRWLADTGSDVDIVFIHNARTPHDIIYAKELELLSAMYQHIKIALCVSDKSSDGWYGLTGHISPQMIEMIAPDFAQRSIYVCGPGGYMDSVHDMLEWMKFPMENYFSESFGGSSGNTKSNSGWFKNQVAYQGITQTPVKENQTNAITTAQSDRKQQQAGSSISASENILLFKQSSKQVAHDGATTILDISENERIGIPSSCLQGCCGSCKVHKIEGVVLMDEAQQALSAQDINDGYILACCSIPRGKVVIDA